MNTIKNEIMEDFTNLYQFMFNFDLNKIPREHEFHNFGRKFKTHHDYTI